MNLLIIILASIYLIAVIAYKYFLKVTISEALTYATIGMLVTFATKLAYGMILYGEEIVDYGAIPWLIIAYLLIAGPIYQKQKRKIRKKIK